MADYSQLQTIEGFQFLPIGKNKNPIPAGWQKTSSKHDLTDCHSVGIACGRLSGNLEVIDIDLKYDDTGTLFTDFKNLIHKTDGELLKKLVVSQTRNGGYHFIYRCSVVGGNTPLAQRFYTDEEKAKKIEESYNENITAGLGSESAMSSAKRAAANIKLVLIETRGEGGQIVCPPSPGYRFVYGNLLSVSEITPEERETLFSCARQFNRALSDVAMPTARQVKSAGVSVLDDYDNRGDVIGLLERHGWKNVEKKGSKEFFKRPGNSENRTSGNFDHERNRFSVFTTSTVFEPAKGYRPSAVFATLECDGNFIEAVKKLAQMGYGESSKNKSATSVNTPEVVIEEQPYETVFDSSKDHFEYIKAVKEGTLEMGKTTGIPSLDEFFLFKKSKLIFNNGFDGTGKTAIGYYFWLLSAMLHGWKWVVYTAENSNSYAKRKMIEFYCGKRLDNNGISDDEINEAVSFIDKHFFFIKKREVSLSYVEVINSAKLAIKEHGHIDYIAIDPYGSLNPDSGKYDKGGVHEFHKKVLRDIVSFKEFAQVGFWINIHPGTPAARMKDDKKEYTLAPQKQDTDGGVIFSNNADFFLSTHRLVGHPELNNVTEIHVRKVREKETGGRETPPKQPVLLEMYKGAAGYIERIGEGVYGVDPVESIKNGGKKTLPPVQLLFGDAKNSGWLPYKDDTDAEIGF